MSWGGVYRECYSHSPPRRRDELRWSVSWMLQPQPTTAQGWAEVECIVNVTATAHHSAGMSWGGVYRECYSHSPPRRRDELRWSVSWMLQPQPTTAQGWAEVECIVNVAARTERHIAWWAEPPQCAPWPGRLPPPPLHASPPPTPLPSPHPPPHAVPQGIINAAEMSSCSDVSQSSWCVSNCKLFF